MDYNLRQTLVIPDCAKEPSRLAKVVQLGDGRMKNGETWQFDVKVGDIVISNRYPKSCQAFEWNGQKVLMVSEEEILAVLEV